MCHLGHALVPVQDGEFAFSDDKVARSMDSRQWIGGVLDDSVELHVRFHHAGDFWLAGFKFREQVVDADSAYPQIGVEARPGAGEVEA